VGGRRRRSASLSNAFTLAILIPPVASALENALNRGVEVIVLVPAQPEEQVRAARRNPERRLLFDREARLGTYKPTFPG
jgi:cardiolipin synthase